MEFNKNRENTKLKNKQELMAELEALLNKQSKEVAAAHAETERLNALLAVLEAREEAQKNPEKLDGLRAVAKEAAVKEQKLMEKRVSTKKLFLLKIKNAEELESLQEEVAKETEDMEKLAAAGVTEAETETEAEAEAEEPKKAGKKRKADKSRNKEGSAYDKIQNFCASVIDLHDRTQAKWDSRFIYAGKSLVQEYENSLRKYKDSRTEIGRAALIIVILCCVMFLAFNKTTVYQYAYNGKVLGYVENQDSVTSVLDVASKELTRTNGTDVTFDVGTNITFNPVYAAGKTVDDTDQALNKLAYMTDIETEAFGIFEKGSLCAIVKSEDTAKNTLEKVKAAQSVPDDGMKLIESNFKYDIAITPVTVKLSSVQTEKAAYKQLLEGGKEKYYHIVEDGEDMATLRKTFGVKQGSIYDETDKHKLSSVSAGDTVCIHKKTEPVTVTMVEDGTMTEIIPYKVIRKKSADIYKGDEVVKRKGVKGIQRITGKLTKENGEVVERDLSKCDVQQKKVDKVILVGTKDRPKTAPTGHFIVPLDSYVVTSWYAWRWGKVHEALDLAAPMGTTIHASDGGTVIYSGWMSSYGYIVMIDHDGTGYETRYGHCSELLVSEGDKVYQGQPIALVGSTGFSTGPHTHFEVRYNGSTVDPAPLVGLS